jgi:radical SAM superfamily enzyme YgiQ (UPF0313 family)
MKARDHRVLLITPPFTQINTPYPATVYIKGFLNTLDIWSYQIDLSLEVILEIFSKSGLQHIFQWIEDTDAEMSDRSFRVFKQAKRYINTIDSVLGFLQNRNATLAHTLVRRDFLPEGDRFDSLTSDLISRFGDMGTYDYARHLCTLYMEDIGDLISEVIDQDFGFSRYAERIGRSASSFDEIHLELQQKKTFITDLIESLTNKYLEKHKPNLVCITIPFPGNVFGAFKIAQTVNKYDPQIKVVIGGGYVNTELRSIYDHRVFDYVDFITLDDGEAPLMHILEYLYGTRSKEFLKRTFLCDEQKNIRYIDGSKSYDIPQNEVGTPDYSDLLLSRYISVLEQVNPMHRLWSDGRWNKMTLAHGCYWGKCSFCDITLDYIARYEPISVSVLCDRIESIINQTGNNGFHFVDEAAPPALMRDLAIEILRRELVVVWWTNIRFEKTFTKDLCRLLRSSGCIAVTGGLEVASDRLLALMKKGVTISQVTKVSQAFTEVGIMVHAYLMYGFPTQTDQETIDSLEIVRQMFSEGVLQSGFWHQFAMTVHSPIGISPQSYKVQKVGPNFDGFAQNDYYHVDPTGTTHDKYSLGLANSLHAYMNGYGYDIPLQSWFDFKIPRTRIQTNHIREILKEKSKNKHSEYNKVFWIGGEAISIKPMKSKKTTEPLSKLTFNLLGSDYKLVLPSHLANWFLEILGDLADTTHNLTLADLESNFPLIDDFDFKTFLQSSYFDQLRERGLLIL